MPTETCRIFIDMRQGEVPKPGHFVVTVGWRNALNSAYLIWKVRPPRARPDGAVRFRLVCFRASVEDAQKARQIWYMRWYPREKKTA